jgi:hypothetical protein
MSDLPIETRDRIEQDASKWSENQYGHDDVNMDYLEGALHEAGRAQWLVEALELIERKLTGINDTVTNDILNIARTELAKYKEVSNG